MKKEDLQQIAAMVAEMMRDNSPTPPRGGLPRETMHTLTARVPQEFIDLLDRMAGELKQTRSEVLRDILRETSVKRARK